MAGVVAHVHALSLRHDGALSNFSMIHSSPLALFAARKPVHQPLNCNFSFPQTHPVILQQTTLGRPLHTCRALIRTNASLHQFDFPLLGRDFLSRQIPGERSVNPDSTLFTHASRELFRSARLADAVSITGPNTSHLRWQRDQPCVAVETFFFFFLRDGYNAKRVQVMIYRARITISPDFLIPFDLVP